MFVGSAKKIFASQLKELAWLLEREQDSDHELLIPATIFSSHLSPLQSLVIYLKDVDNFSFQDIAKQLSRAYPTIYAAYKPPQEPAKPTKHLIPLAFFGGELSVLESCVLYLKEEDRMSLSAIGRLLNKNPRTIWSTYDRVKKKR